MADLAAAGMVPVPGRWPQALGVDLSGSAVVVFGDPVVGASVTSDHWGKSFPAKVSYAADRVSAGSGKGLA
jgi:hypothetical protein